MSFEIKTGYIPIERDKGEESMFNFQLVYKANTKSE
jgi:hypothetical protein